MRQLEKRTITGQGAPTLRTAENASGSVQGGRTITGYAIVFDVPSNVLCDGYGTFIETIERGAITEEKLRQWDIRALLEHNNERLLARWRKGAGTLQLALDDVGLRYTFEAPDTEDGRTAVELVRRGDIVGSSFAYLCDEASVVWSKTPDGIPTRTVKDITYMEDVSIVSRPAYDQTSVTVRTLQEVAGDAQEKQMKDYILAARHEAENASKIAF